VSQFRYREPGAVAHPMPPDQGNRKPVPPGSNAVVLAADRKPGHRQARHADLDRILKAGRRSPSSQNWQPWDFVLGALATITPPYGELNQAVAVALTGDIDEFRRVIPSPGTARNGPCSRGGQTTATPNGTERPPHRYPADGPPRTSLPSPVWTRADQRPRTARPAAATRQGRR
jgi:hypothetical protein